MITSVARDVRVWRGSRGREFGFLNHNFIWMMSTCEKREFRQFGAKTIETDMYNREGAVGS